MSDTNKRIFQADEHWTPLDVSMLEDYSEEKYQRTDKTHPNFELFKALYEPPEVTAEEEFRLLYDPDAQLGNEGQAGKKAGPPDTGSPGGQPLQEEEPVDEAQQAIARGYDQGFKEGRDEGYAQGVAQGEEKGYSEGYAKGEAEARQQGDIRAKEILDSLETILQELDTVWSDTVRENEKQILDLICRIAGRVVYATVELNEDTVREAVLNALSSMPEPREIVLNVSPEDYEYIELVKDEFFEKVKTLSSVSVVASSSVNRGGCIIETPTATVRADVEDRLQAVYSSIMEAENE